MSEDKKVVWVIEDDRQILYHNRDLFLDQGYEVVCFRSVEEALAKLGYDEATQKINPDLPPPYAIVTDNRTLGDATGMRLMAALKGTNIGRVLTSGDDLGLSDVQKVSGAPARCASKQGDGDIVALARESAEAAALEMAGIVQKSGGRVAT